jgi:hypothetical protein
MAVPIDVLLTVLVRREGISNSGDLLRLFAGHASLNVVYWFGSSSRAR